MEFVVKVVVVGWLFKQSVVLVIGEFPFCVWLFQPAVVLSMCLHVLVYASCCAGCLLLHLFGRASFWLCVAMLLRFLVHGRSLVRVVVFRSMLLW